MNKAFQLGLTLALTMWSLTACNLQDLKQLQDAGLIVVEVAAPSPTPNPSPSRPEATALTPSEPQQASTLSSLLALSDEALFKVLVSEGIGECFIQDARSCSHCFCEYYFKAKTVPWRGKGWPVNPYSGDSTGCISNIQWDGYNRDMATPNLIHNGAAQARDALLDRRNPCGIDQDLMPGV